MHIHPLLKVRKIQVSLGILGVCLVALSLKGCGSEQEREQLAEVPAEVSVLRIAPGLQRSFRTTGEVEAEKSANFLADFTSTVEDIKVRIGDRVNAGQELLALKAREVEQDLTTANAMYVSTAQNLQQTRITAQQAVAEAQIALKTAQINLEKLQTENAAKKTQAEETLNTSKLTYELSEASAQSTLDTAIRKTQTTVQSALTDADDLLEYSPVQEGLTYVKETHLGVRDPAQKLQTIDALNDAYLSYSAFVPGYTNSIELLHETEGAMQMLLTVLYNSVSSPEYTQVTINTNIGTVNGHIASVRSLISELEAAQRALDSTMQKRGATSQVLIDAQAKYETTMAELDASMKKAELDVERARSVLESAIASAKASEISAVTNVTSARGTLDQAKISNDKLIIVAPFDGLVTDIPVRIGRELQPGEQVLSMEDASWLKVVTYVSVAEVKLLSVGDTVIIGTQQLPASVTSVAPSADPQSKKFKVEARIGSGSLAPGEFVSMQFVTESADPTDDRMFLPVTAVHVSAAETFVWVIEEDANHAEGTQQSQESLYTATKRPVTIGELSGKYIEITSGIQEGDSVVLEGGRALTREGQIVTISGS